MLFYHKPVTNFCGLFFIVCMVTPSAYADTTYTSNNENANIDTQEADLFSHENATAQNGNNSVTATSNLYSECSILHIDAARLACYDKVAITGLSGITPNKQPVDIIKTVEESLRDRAPRLVLAQNPNNSSDPVIADTSVISSSNLLTDSEVSQSTDLLITNPEAVLQRAGVTPNHIGRYTPLSLAYDLDKNSEVGVWSVRPYHPMYLMPVYLSMDPNRNPSTPTQEVHTYDVNEYDPLELKAQLSVKTKVAEDLFDTSADLWFGYTQQMHWQVYNEDNSRPFRANDYQPEIFLTQPVAASLPFNGRLRMLGVGGIHHSNGQSDPLSRSWNRLYLMGGAEWRNLSIVPRIWAHVKNETDSNPSDNPDITDYYGYGDIKALYDFGGGQTLAATGRYNFSENKGAIQLDYTYPFTKDVHGFFQIFHGYGESIIDYNEETTTFGVGLALNDWKGL